MMRVHCTACGQTFLTDTTDRCPLCRAAGTLVEPESAAAVKDIVARKQVVPVIPKAGPGMEKMNRLVMQTIRAVHLILGAVAAFAIGISRLVYPEVRGRRGGLQPADVWIALAAIVAGLGMIGLSIYLVKRSSWAEPPQRTTHGQGPPPPGEV